MNAREPGGHRVRLVVWLVAPLSATVLAVAACAVSSEEGQPREEVPEGVVVPDASYEASAPNDAAPEGDAVRPCGVGTICRVPSPLTVGSVVSIAGRAKDDVWASASRGLLMRWDGEQWNAVESASTEVLTSIALTPSEVWGVSGRAIVHRGIDPSTVIVSRPAGVRYFSGVAALADGAIYTCNAPLAGEYVNDKLLGQFDPVTNKYAFVPDPVVEATNLAHKMAIRAMHVVPGKFIWLVGDHGGVVRYRESPVGSGVVVPLDSQINLQAAWGYDAHVWVVGSYGAIFHYDGAAWHVSDSGTSVMLNAVFGFSPDDIWAAGDEGTVLHFDGNGWGRVEIPGYVGNLRTIWGASSDDVWIGGEGGLLHWGALR